MYRKTCFSPRGGENLSMGRGRTGSGEGAFSRRGLTFGRASEDVDTLMEFIVRRMNKDQSPDCIAEVVSTRTGLRPSYPIFRCEFSSYDSAVIFCVSRHSQFQAALYKIVWT